MGVSKWLNFGKKNMNSIKMSKILLLAMTIFKI